jgi:hypothetical protein
MNKWPKIKKKNPQFLKGIQFNIPLFAAEKQMYKCLSVEEIDSTPEGKDYNICLSEVKQRYSVPERVDISLFIPHTDANGETARVVMIEVRDDTNRRLPLSKATTSKQNVSSLAGLKEVFYNMAKTM